MKRVLAMLCAGICAFGITGCGDEEKAGSVNGYSSPEKAFEVYAEASLSYDAEKYMTLIPEAGVKYITDEYGVGEKELVERREALWGARPKWEPDGWNYEITKTEDGDVAEMTSYIEKLEGEEVGEITSVRHVYYTATGISDGSETEIDFVDTLTGYATFWEADGKWYSADAAIDIEAVAKWMN